MLKLKGKLFTRVLRLIFGSSVIVKHCQDLCGNGADVAIFCGNLLILPTKDEIESVGV